MQKLQRSYSSPARAFSALKSVIPGQHVAQSNPMLPRRSPSFKSGVSKLSGIMGLGSKQSRPSPVQNPNQKASSWSKVQSLFKDKTLAQRAQGPPVPQGTTTKNAPTTLSSQKPKSAGWEKLRGLFKDKALTQQRAQGTQGSQGTMPQKAPITANRQQHPQPRPQQS